MRGQFGVRRGKRIRCGRRERTRATFTGLEALEPRWLMSTVCGETEALTPHAVYLFDEGGLFAPHDPDEPVEFSAGTGWSQPGGPGSPITITYSYSNFLDGSLDPDVTAADLRAATEESLGLWATYAPLHFVEVPDVGPPASDTGYSQAGAAMIRIGHHPIGDNILAHAYFPGGDGTGLTGDVHFDSTKNWRYGAGSGTRVHEVMVHELGHSLGLGHENNVDSIMNSGIRGVYGGPGTGFLYADDIAGIRAIYGTGVGSVTPLNITPPIANGESFTIDEDGSLTVVNTIGQTLVPAGAPWRYLDNGTNQGTAWRAPGFNDAAWATGAAELGYGDGDEATVVGFGPDANNKFVTTYFRHTFNVASLAGINTLQLRLRRDDGAAVYLNGVEIARSNLDPAAATIAFNQFAVVSVGGSTESDWFVLNLDVASLPPGTLVAGSNTLAAEVHQFEANSSDLTFDLSLSVLTANNSVLNNDVDNDGNQPLIAQLFEPPANGTVQLNSDGTFTYTPNADFSGVDTFRYHVFDGIQRSYVPATVTINVTPLPDLPKPADDSYVVDEDAVLTVGQSVVLVPSGAAWRYLDNGSDQGTAWREAAFNDSAWAVGAAELGYGDGDEATVVSFGPDSEFKHVTTYFRRTFNVTNAAAVTRLELELLRDDGAAVYLNGVEIARDRLDPGADYNDPATTTSSGADETTFHPFTIDLSALPAGTLREGANTLAVEVHQAQQNSSDLSFNLRLTAIVGGLSTLANDVHPDGLPFTPELLTPPANGDVVFNLDGTFTYTPDADFNGVDTFTYQLIDDRGVVVVPMGSTWRYLDNGTNQGTAWRAPGFNDTTWATGPGQLGYGDGDEATVVSFGPSASAKYATTYFRTAFNVADPASVRGLSLSLLRDDAAAVYLNGVEIFRDANLPANAAFNQYATSTLPTDNAVVNFTANPSLLVVGNNVIAVEVHQASGNSSDLSFDMSVGLLVPSPPATVTIDVRPVNDAPVAVADAGFTVEQDGVLVFGGQVVNTLVAQGAVWKYLDNGTNQGTAWRNLGFNDASWASGPAELGYGDGDEATIVSFGPSSSNKYLTTYFRHTFMIPDHAEQYVTLNLLLKRDDGAAVYLNGVEIARSNLAANAAFNTPASGVTSSENTFHPFTIDLTALPPGVLVNGANVVAAEVHQSDPGSSDMSFDLSLTGTRVMPDTVLANDVDVDGDALRAVLDSPPAHGTVSLGPEGGFTYTPAPGYSGPDSFTYRAVDAGVTTIFNAGAVWRYLDNGSDQGTAWRAPTFNDASWAAGPAKLGYGDGDEATVISFGPDANNRYATSYFRRAFVIADPSPLADLRAMLLRDDAAAIYLNGVEVYRDANLPANAAYNTYATSGVVDENAFVTIPLDASLLVAGSNVIAVEVHQSGPTSSDVSFDLALLASLRSAPVTVSIDVTSPFLLGDVNRDGFIDDLDIDYLYANLGSADPLFDLNGSGGPADQADVDSLVRDILETQYGDLNLDRRVNITDLSALATRFGAAGQGWRGGDITGDGTTGIADLSRLAVNFGFNNAGGGAGEGGDVDLLAEASPRVVVAPGAANTIGSNSAAGSWRHIRDVLDATA